jgi:rhomboid protease GluP
VTASLIAINALIYGLMVFGAHRVMGFDSATLINAGATFSTPGFEPSRWRWLTAAFVHVGLLHALMNLYVLGQIGIISERALGRGLIAAMYVVTGVTGNILSTVLATARGATTISAGASGAIMGLIGMAASFAWLSGQRAAARALAINILFVLGLGISLSMGRVAPIDNAAHIGGLVVGVIAGVLRARRPQPFSRLAEALLIGGALLLTAVAFAVVLLVPEPFVGGPHR